MSDPNIKEIKLVSSGTQKGGRTRKAAKNPSKKFEMPTITKVGGGSTSPGTATQLISSHVPNAPGSKPLEPVGVNSGLTQAGTPAQKGGSSSAAANPVKVVLGALKKSAKVVLAADAAMLIASAGVASALKAAPFHYTLSIALISMYIMSYTFYTVR